MKVRFFAQLQVLVGVAEIELPVPRPIGGDELWSLLAMSFPALAPWRESTRLACNLTYAAPLQEFGDQDEIALIPPVSGG